MPSFKIGHIIFTGALGCPGSLVRSIQDTVEVHPGPFQIAWHLLHGTQGSYLFNLYISNEYNGRL